MCSGCYLPSYQVLDALVTALAMDRERAVQLWHAARDGREERCQAEKMARHRPPEDWTALPALPAAVQSLLRAQVRAAQELPYRLPGGHRWPRSTCATSWAAWPRSRSRSSPGPSRCGMVANRCACLPRRCRPCGWRCDRRRAPSGKSSTVTSTCW